MHTWLLDIEMVHIRFQPRHPHKLQSQKPNLVLQSYLLRQLFNSHISPSRPKLNRQLEDEMEKHHLGGESFNSLPRTSRGWEMNSQFLLATLFPSGRLNWLGLERPSKSHGHVLDGSFTRRPRSPGNHLLFREVPGGCYTLNPSFQYLLYKHKRLDQFSHGCRELSQGWRTQG